ncbi:MAG: TnpV protein [Monoglobales bacterium]
MKERITENGIDYVLVGDYYVPDLKLPEENRPIGRFGRMHREYIKEHKPFLYDDLVLTCQLWTYLADLNEQAQSRLAVIIEQMKKAESVTKELKKNDQWKWIQSMNSIRHRAEEIVLYEMIYC